MEIAFPLSFDQHSPIEMTSNRFEELPDEETSSARSLTPPPLSQNREQQSSTPSIPPLPAPEDDEEATAVAYTIEEVRVSRFES